MEKKVSELVEWAAILISESHMGEQVKTAKQILSHPDLALIDREYCGARVRNCKAIIPLADELKEAKE